MTLSNIGSMSINWCDIEPIGLVALSNIGSMSINWCALSIRFNVTSIDVALGSMSINWLHCPGSMSHQLTWHWTGSMSHGLVALSNTMSINWCDCPIGSMSHQLTWIVNRYKSIDVALSNIGSMSHQLTCSIEPILVQCQSIDVTLSTDIGSQCYKSIDWALNIGSSQLMWHVTNWLQVQCDVTLSNWRMLQVNWCLNRCWTQVNWCDIEPILDNIYKSIDVTLNRYWTMLQVNWCDIEPILDNATSQLMWHWTDVGQYYKSIDVTL